MPDESVSAGLGIEDMRKLIQKIQGFEGLIGPRGGMGNWRRELGFWVQEAASEVRQNFITHSANGTPFANVARATMLRRTNVAMRSDPEAMVDEGRVTHATAANVRSKKYVTSSDVGKSQREFGGEKQGQDSAGSIRGWRGLRDVASNTVAGKYPGLSLYKMGKLTVTFGVKAGDSSLPYAHSLLTQWRGRPGRNYMALDDAKLKRLIKNEVEAGVLDRLDAKNLERIDTAP